MALTAQIIVLLIAVVVGINNAFAASAIIIRKGTTDTVNVGSSGRCCNGGAQQCFHWTDWLETANAALGQVLLTGLFLASTRLVKDTLGTSVKRF